MPRTISKTSSGKIARQLVKKAYLEECLCSIASWSEFNVGIDKLSFENSTFSDETSEYLNKISEIKKLDPTTFPSFVVIYRLKCIVVACLGPDVSVNSLIVNKPLISLGLDSMQSIQLQSMLEENFTILLPDELLFEPDATIQTLCDVLIAGGVMKNRPILVSGFDILSEVRKRRKNHATICPMTPQWIRENQIKSNIDTHLFSNKSISEKVKMKLFDIICIVAISFMIIFFCVFISFPVLILLTALNRSFFSNNLLVSTFGFLVMILVWPKKYLFRTDWIFARLMQFFSYRIIIESPLEHYNIPGIYFFGPYENIGVFFQAYLNYYFTGIYLQYYIKKEVVFMSYLFPFINLFLRHSGLNKIVTDGVQKWHLKDDKNLAICPTINGFYSFGGYMDIKEQKKIIRLALETGVNIVPCYCFYSFKNLSLRDVPVLSVIGKPISCPAIVNPSSEIVHEYHEKYLCASRKIFDHYEISFNG
jgi:acyl carrier protein